MPPAGTFPHLRADDLRLLCRDAYKMPPELIEQVVGSLSRCGAALAAFRASGWLGEGGPAVPKGLRPPAAEPVWRVFYFTAHPGGSTPHMHGYDMTGKAETVYFTLRKEADPLPLLTFDEDRSGKGRA